MSDTLKNLYQVVEGRKQMPQEGSYTCYLFEKGLDKILKTIGEECAETIIAAKNGGYPYPCKEFFKIVAEYNAKVVIGVDAHIPPDFIKNRYDIVMEYVKELNLNLIKDFRVK